MCLYLQQFFATIDLNFFYMGCCHKPFRFFILIILVCCLSCKKNNSSYPPVVTDSRTWIVSTVAGNGQEGSSDGPAEQVRLGWPHSITADSSGNLFVSDGSIAIRKISNGQVITLPYRTSDGNLVSGSCFGLTFDNQGNIYNIKGNSIYKINQSGSSTVFAGSHAQGFKDGQDTTARFNVIEMIARDVEGNLYLPDYDLQSNFYIRKVSPAGTVTSLSLNDNTGSISGSRPIIGGSGGPIAVDRKGNIYFSGYNIIKKADPQGNVSIFSGSTNGRTQLLDGSAKHAQFGMINGMACDSSGNLYVCDWSNSAVRKVMPDGRVTTIAGSPVAGRGFKDGKGNVAQFHNLTGITVDKNGVVYIADRFNNRIRKLEYK